MTASVGFGISCNPARQLHAGAQAVHALLQIELTAAAAAARGESLHVAAGAERAARAGENDGADVAIRGQTRQCDCIASIIGPDIALRASGRFIVKRRNAAVVALDQMLGHGHDLLVEENV
jgi:hypothetical protein